MSEATKDSISALKRPKRRTPSQVNADCLYSYQMIPVSQAIVNKLIEELPEWPLKNPQATMINEFFFSHHLTRTTYYELLKRYPKLKDAHEIAMMRLGERLWTRSLNKQYDWNAAKKRMYRYDSDFDEDDKRDAKLRADQTTEGPRIITVEIPVYKKPEE